MACEHVQMQMVTNIRLEWQVFAGGRFLRRGFSQARAAVTIWLWCLSLAAAALATRFIPFRAHGVWHVWPTLAAAAIALVALLFSVYVVYVLEIVKLGNRIQRRRKPDDPLRKIA